MSGYFWIFNFTLNSSSLHNTTRAIVTIPPPQPSVVNIFKYVYIGIATCSLLFSLLSTTVLVSHRPLRGYSVHAYLLSLSVAGGVSSVLLVLNTIFELQKGMYVGSDPWKYFVCKFWYSRSVLWFSMISAGFMVAALAVDQYVAVVFPVFYKTKFSKRKIFPCVMIGSSIAMGFLSMLPHMFLSMKISERGHCLSPLDWSPLRRQYFLGVYTFATQYLFTLGTIIFSYSRIAWTLFQRSRVKPRLDTTASSGRPLDGKVVSLALFQQFYTIFADRKIKRTDLEDGRLFRISGESVIIRNVGLPSFNVGKRDVRDNSDTRTAGPLKNISTVAENARNSVLRTSIWIAVCYICCHSLHQIHYLLFNLKILPVDRNNPEFVIRFVLVYLHSCLNPLIYYVQMDEFKEGLNSFVGKVKLFMTSRFY